MKKHLQDINSRIHQATSAAPEIDRVLREAQNVPFTSRIARFNIPNPGKIRLPRYDGTTDPSQHLTTFTVAMGRAQFTAAEKDAGYCQLFAESLEGAALRWFCRLNADSVDSFQQLSTAFLKHYSMFIQQGHSTADLWAMSQGKKESLRDFIARFKEVASRVTVSDDAALPALRNALWYESPFRDDLKLNRPATLEDALHRATLFIEVEEEKAALSKKYSKGQTAKEKEKTTDDYKEPYQHYDQDYLEEKQKRLLNYHVGNLEQLERPPAEWRSQRPTDQDHSKFCSWHNRTGHGTDECRHLKDILLRKFEKGEVDVTNFGNYRKKHTYHRQEGGYKPYNDRDKDRRPEEPRTYNRRNEERRQEEKKEPNWRPHEAIMAIRDEEPRRAEERALSPPRLGYVTPKRERDNRYPDEPPPAPRKKIMMIMGGLKDCNDSIRSIRKHKRRVTSSVKWAEPPSSSIPDFFKSKPAITFTTDDLAGVHTPHNDPLVIELLVADCEVAKVMIDTGSSVDLIFKNTLDRMDLRDNPIKTSSKPLTAFNGETTMSIGTIRLPVIAGGVTKIVKFTVIDTPTIYNIIMGTPWIYSMEAVPSTYHQCIKFPTSLGVRTIRGNQSTARECFIAELKIRKVFAITGKSQHSADPKPNEPDIEEPPKMERILQVNIDERDVSRCVGIGENLTNELQEELIKFLKENVATFAWSPEDMPGIDPKIACHELNVDPTYRPIKQKKRKLGPERAQAVNEEVQRLMQAGSIEEVRYPDWLANPVVVKKKSGKWRVCVDFTDLNKACPKDSFPLPNIDRIVEATAGNELLSFMDAFSGYNQIMMHPDDREKTSFITDRGTYCYRVMPFGLKNAGATYQRLVNEMFADQLGKTMEVYIDDMLVKSATAKDHVDHLRTCFKTLNRYGMKLNPAKCTFAVTSGEFLGYIVTQRGIEANPKQISAIKELKSPKNPREVQRLTGRIAALNRFIARSTDKCLPFYQLLRGNKKFEWDEKCEKAFEELKLYLSTPPILSKPLDQETLYLYIAISVVAVSAVLVREDRGDQKPVFYISKSLDGAESRYPTLEKIALAVVVAARKLRPYFQSHSIVVLTDQPLRTILHSPTQSGRIAKWAVELSEYDIEYRSRTSAKSQVLADFIIELSPELEEETPETMPWTLFVDGSSNQRGAGIGVKLESPTKEVLEQSFRLAFQASNNEAEYEALIAGMKLALELGAKKLSAYCDSQLVASQFNGEFGTKNERMDAYLTVVKKWAAKFDPFVLTKIPRSANAAADALAALASTSDPTVRRVIPVGCIEHPSIDAPSDSIQAIYYANERVVDLSELEKCPVNIPKAQHDVDTLEDLDWRTAIKLYIADGELPKDKWEARRLRRKAAHYTLLDDKLCRWSATGVLLHCINGDETIRVMREAHEGAGGTHSGGRRLAIQIKNAGFYWPTMLQDCENFAKKCEKCQRHGPTIHTPTQALLSATAPYPFMRWAMDIVGPLPLSRQKRFVLIMTDYFSKWVEAKAFSKIKSSDVQSFVWKYIICRHGLPFEIVADNGSQFTSGRFEGFCYRWNIRLSKSTPRYPQGNGQAESTNKTILDGLKKRLEDKKNLWADELDGVLWSHRTSPRTSTGRTPFALSHGIEAMTPAEANVPGLRRNLLPQHPKANNILMTDHLDFIEEQRDQALLRIQNYQQQTASYYNKSVRNRQFEEGDFVLRKTFENTEEKPKTKLGANWEGPYLISKVVRPGVYELMKMDGEPIQRSWNAAHLKRFYH